MILNSHRAIRIAVAFAGALVLTATVPGLIEPATGATPSSVASSAGVRASLRSALDDYVQTYGSEEHVSAVSLAVTFRHRKPGIDLTAGTTRYGAGRAVPPHALWQIGSNTKAFTSVLMLQLEADHRVSIDDPLGKWLPQYPAWSDVTIKRLLNMTSGIPNYTGSLTFWSDLGKAPNHKLSAAELVAYAIPMPATQGYSYSNTNYVLAQMIVERASGESYEKLLQQKIFEPLGLHNTFYSGHDYAPAVTARMPAGYFYVGLPVMASQLGKDQRRNTVSWAQGAGAIVSSLDDLGRWDHALFTGQELPRKQQRELTSLVSAATGEPITRTTQSDPVGYGLGVNQVTSQALGTVWYYEGETDGYRVVNLYAPKSGTTIAIGVNSTTLDDNTGALATSIFVTLHDAGLA